MAFALTLQAKSISADGNSLVIEDVSDWTQDGQGRANYAVIMKAVFRTSDTPQELAVDNSDPVLATEWSVPSVYNGRYTSQAFAFYIKGGANSPNSGDVQWDNVAKELQQYDGASWSTVILDDVTDKAVHTSAALETPVLNHAYSYFNEENLEYIREVKRELDGGAKQNRLFYKRTNVDYLMSLIRGAEYKWGLGAYSEFYEIVLSLENIMSTGNIE